MPKLLVASSNPGKLSEYRALNSAAPLGLRVSLELLPRFSELPPFPETAPTFAENAAGKALHYSRYAGLPVLAEDSGLAVAALDGRPGVHSARYAGPGASDAQRVSKLLAELDELGDRGAADRSARFICVIALAIGGRMLSVISDAVAGEILRAPRGAGGFGYDPVFLFPPLGKTFAEMPPEQKNLYSHRGGAFRKLLDFCATCPVL